MMEGRIKRICLLLLIFSFSFSLYPGSLSAAPPAIPWPPVEATLTIRMVGDNLIKVSIVVVNRTDEQLYLFDVRGSIPKGTTFSWVDDKGETDYDAASWSGMELPPRASIGPFHYQVYTGDSEGPFPFFAWVPFTTQSGIAGEYTSPIVNVTVVSRVSIGEAKAEPAVEAPKAPPTPTPEPTAIIGLPKVGDPVTPKVLIYFAIIGVAIISLGVVLQRRYR